MQVALRPAPQRLFLEPSIKKKKKKNTNMPYGQNLFSEIKPLFTKKKNKKENRLILHEIGECVNSIL